MRVHETLRRWLIDAADAAIEYAARDEIDEGARKFREAIETAAAVAYESQQLPVLGNLNRMPISSMVPPNGKLFTCAPSKPALIQS